MQPTTTTQPVVSTTKVVGGGGVPQKKAAIVRQDGKRKQGGDGTSGWVWYAGRALYEYLMLQYNNDIDIDNNNVPLRGMSILEFGSGTGWLAIELALKGAMVTATDRMDAMPLLIQNIATNIERFVVGSRNSEEHDELFLEVHCLEWISNSDLIKEEIEGSDDVDDGGGESNHQLFQYNNNNLMMIPGKWDLIVGSDLIYISEHYKALLETLARHDCKHYILAYEERKPAEEIMFLKMSSDYSFQTNRSLAGINPETGNRVWIVRMEKS
uniref:Calmodulin-lysine N-methyltransferase n=1 Tax=Ditylum brightwellii TaxID=49249 RepID=A0A7S1YQH5_9STRA|mmetsp:Transcript_13656/g.20388  ORF Transcript_13656/g.20388 Transcript_13656/m.20388 type:complete len:269 (+) Transcript_13656:216-1022(+)